MPLEVDRRMPPKALELELGVACRHSYMVTFLWVIGPTYAGRCCMLQCKVDVSQSRVRVMTHDTVRRASAAVEGASLGVVSVRYASRAMMLRLGLHPATFGGYQPRQTVGGW